MYVNITFEHVNAKMIIPRKCAAAASMLVEAVIESIVSIYEGTNKEYLEEREELKMMISLTGPKLEHANSIPKASISKHCNGIKCPSGTLCENHKT